MKKSFKILSIVALILILCGGVVFLVGFIGTGASFKKMSFIESSQVKTFTETAEISSVSIRAGSADVTVEISETAEKISVEYTDLVTKKGDSVQKLLISETDGALRMTVKTNWLKTIFSFSSPSIKIKLNVPKERAISLQVVTNSGDIRMQGENAAFHSLRMEVNTGDILLTNTNVVCQELAVLEADTGDVKIGRLEAKTVRLETDTGDVTLSGVVKADDLTIEVDTGSIYGASGLLDTKKATVEADTGDVKIKMAGKKSDYEIRVETDTGDKNIENQIGGERTLKIETDTGDIHVSFAE